LILTLFSLFFNATFFFSDCEREKFSSSLLFFISFLFSFSGLFVFDDKTRRKKKKEKKKNYFFFLIQWPSSCIR